MTAPRPIIILAVFFIGLIPVSVDSFAQSTDLDPGKWAIVLSKDDRASIDSLNTLLALLQKTDSARAFQFVDELAENEKSKGDRFRALHNCLKAAVIFHKLSYYEIYQDRKSSANQELVRQQLIDLFSEAIEIAYRIEDDLLVAYISYMYASAIVMFGEVGLSVMYSKNAIDLYERLSEKVIPQYYQFLAELLYKVREYNECIHYAKKAVAAWQTSPNEFKPFTVSCMNTVALGYHRQKMYDSAFIFYNQALALAKQIKDTVWTGIVSGNMGQILYAQGKYDSAYALLKLDYISSKERKFFDNAAHSLQWAARANLARGNKATALAEVREAYQLLKVWPDANYLRNAHYTSVQIFREMGNYDSAFYYNNLYSAINDSLEKVIATSSLAISKARLNDETSRYNIQSLNREKQSQVLYRNIIIASIIVLSILALLIVNRQRLKEKIKTEKAEMAKLRIEQEVASAKAQMSIFTENIVEKANLIEKLELQIKGKEATADQQTIISELSQQTILTEEDWNKFKSLFEKIYPGFFIKLRDKFPDITIAEQRMAALTRLRLTSKQIASMLGISVDSVHKSRQRLRQRFHVGTDSNLDELVANL